MLPSDDEWSLTLLRALSLAPGRVTDVEAWHRHIPFAL